MAERTQLLSDLSNILLVAKANQATVDVGTLVGLLWGEADFVPNQAFEEALSLVRGREPGDSVLLRLNGPQLEFLDAETGTEQYAVLEVGAPLAYPG